MVFTVNVNQTTANRSGCGGSFKHESHFKHMQPLRAWRSKPSVITTAHFPNVWHLITSNMFGNFSAFRCSTEHYSVFYHQDDILIYYQLHHPPSLHSYQSTLHNVLTQTENAVENKNNALCSSLTKQLQLIKPHLKQQWELLNGM